MWAELGSALALAATLWPLNADAETVAILCSVPGLPPEINASDPELRISSTVKFELDLSNSFATAYNSKGQAVIKNMPLTSSDKEFKLKYQFSNGSWIFWTLDRSTLQLGRVDSPRWTTFEPLNCRLFRKQL
jgi:hypothetical protein